MLSLLVNVSCRCGGPNFDDFLRQAFIDDAYEALSDEQKVSQGHLYV